MLLHTRPGALPWTTLKEINDLTSSFHSLDQALMELGIDRKVVIEIFENYSWLLQNLEDREEARLLYVWRFNLELDRRKLAEPGF